MNRRYLMCSILVASGLCVSWTQAQDLTKGEKDTVLIGTLNVQPSVQALAKSKGRELQLKRASDSLESQLISALNATRVFQIVERARLGDLTVEQALIAVAGNPNDKNAAQALKLAGAKYAFLPQLDGFEDRVEKQRFDNLGRVSMHRELFMSVVVKVVDTTTGMLLPDSPSVQLTKTETVDMARSEANLESDQLIVALAKEMASQLSQEVITLLRPAKVLTVTGTQILINRGLAAGFRKGDIVDVYAVQDMKDEDSGEIFRNEVQVGHARIERSDPRQSFGMIEGEDTGIAKGCVVRVVKSASGDSSASVPVMAPQDEVTPGSSEKPLKFN
jgi:curli biogenesis system outer membrane secretion channel CsgG